MKVGKTTLFACGPPLDPPGSGTEKIPVGVISANAVMLGIAPGVAEMAMSVSRDEKIAGFSVGISSRESSGIRDESPLI